jgi:hypothetical protein
MSRTKDKITIADNASQGPVYSSTVMADLATVMLEPIPSNRWLPDAQRLDAPGDPPIIMYGNKSFPWIPYLTKTPEGFGVEVLVPDPKEAHLRNASGGWANNKSDDLWQCTAHALGTWNADTRMGYIVDIKEGIWAILNDPAIAEVIMKPSPLSLAGTLLKAPEVGDIFVIWEDKESGYQYDQKTKTLSDIVVPLVEANGRRPACHAVRIEEPHYTPADSKLQTPSDGSIGTLDLVQTMVSSKNGNNALQTSESLDLIVRNPDYKLRSQAIYRLKGKFKTPLASWKPCNCDHCYEARGAIWTEVP